MMLRLLARGLRPYRGTLVVVAVLLLGQAIGNLYLPELNAEIINNGVVKGDTDLILRVGAQMLAVAVAVGIGAIVGVYLAARVAMGFGRDVRGLVFRSVQDFSQQEVNVFGTASLITRNTNDVQQVQMVVLMMMTVMVSAPFMAIGGVIMAVRQDVPLSAILVVILPLMAGVVAIVMRRALPMFQSMQRRVDRLNLVSRETLAGIRVIRAFVRTRFEEQRFDEANADLTAVALSVNRLFALVMPTIFGIMNLSIVAIMWFGAFRVDSGEMPIGNLTAFLTYIMQILMSVMMAVLMFVMVPRAAASAERINAVIETIPSVRDPETPRRHGDVRGQIEFRDVEFRYPGAQDPVLKGISFKAGPGEITAIVGSTGSGKSTLVGLVPRLFDVTGGAVLIDGVDVRELRREVVWRAVGIVPQKAFLFSGTIASNLRYGDQEATDEALWHALEVAQAKDFVDELERKLDAEVSQGGTNLSGGQRQRMAIARALVRRPEIYVFDDSFSALDFATDARLRAALGREIGDSTVLIVAQRVGTIMHADRIVVLDGGEAVGIGTHHELLETCETYREIVLSQISAEEAA